MSDPSDQARPAFTTAAEAIGMKRPTTSPTPGLSASPGLQVIAGSTVPGHDRQHVSGPQQSPVDPVAAGLDFNHNPLTRAEDRVITLTGQAASGPHIGPNQPLSDHSMVQAPPDTGAPTMAPIEPPAATPPQTA